MLSGKRSRRLSIAGMAVVIVLCGLTVGAAGCSSDSDDPTPTPATHAISGRVTGAVSSGVTVALGGAATATTTTDAAGDYAFTALADGAYTVTASRSGHTFAPAVRNVTLAGADVGGQDFAATVIVTPPFAGNVLLDSILPDANYMHAHNSTSTDRTKMLITVNKAATPYTGMTGVTDLYLVDADKMAQGEVAKTLGPVQIGSNATTPMNVVFRSSWTADDSKILVAGKDRLWVLDPATLAPLNGAAGDAGLLAGSNGTYYENHDALPTTDGQYAILTLRTKPHADPDVAKLDGELKLYDLANGHVVGAGVSVCNSCHATMLGANRNATLCGLDGKVEKQADGKYTGTVYVPGHGGHIAKVPLTIDPANTANPITLGTVSTITISSSKFPSTHASASVANTSQYKLHDVRLDGNTLYWSTFNTDANGKVHYGKVDLTTGQVTDKAAIDVDAAATLPAAVAGGGTPNLYCGSGQSATAYMPITMTHKMYLTVIPKF